MMDLQLQLSFFQRYITETNAYHHWSHEDSSVLVNNTLTYRVVHYKFHLHVVGAAMDTAAVSGVRSVRRSVGSAVHVSSGNIRPNSA